MPLLRNVHGYYLVKCAVLHCLMDQLQRLCDIHVTGWRV